MAILPNKTAKPIIGLTPDPLADVNNITKEIMSAFDAIAGSDHAIHAAKVRVNEEGEANRGIRETLALGLSKLSIAHKWDKDKIGDACKAAVTNWTDKTGSNRKITTLGTLVSELKRAMHPAAREHVATAFATAKTAWEEERLAFNEDNEADQPLARVFAKRYHVVMGSKGMLKAYIEATKKDAVITAEHAANPVSLADVREITERQDPNRAARVMARLFDQLQKVQNEFGHPDIKLMLDFAGKISAESLAASKLAMQVAARKAAKAASAGAKMSARVNAKPAPVVAPVVADDDEEEDETSTAIDEMLEDE